MNFFIKQNSTLPELVYPLTEDMMYRYSITPEDLTNVVVTFSMYEQESGIYRIANVAASLITEIQHPEYPEELTYYLVYKFRLHQTRKVGNYSGEFKIDFLNELCVNKLTLPTNEELNIIIGNSITKTTVI